jgi:5-oxoprolinase (ATP-hydrolysing)
MLYRKSIEIEERIDSHGNSLIPFNEQQVAEVLRREFNNGFHTLAVVLMHSYAFPQHELRVGELARSIGYTQVSLSHQVSNSMKLVNRGDTTVVDAYLTPILRNYVNGVAGKLAELQNEAQSPYPTRLMFMQSNGGLVDASMFCGKDCILSGPAGGLVGAVRTALDNGFDKIITFDMGGTSTDVAHCVMGEFERAQHSEVAGYRISAPMVRVHTVAAGGGSILHFKNGKYSVGPDSAAANPGPASYGKGGPLTVTDCNVRLGRLQSEYFPSIPLHNDAVQRLFDELTQTINRETRSNRSADDVAYSFLSIAVDNMAQAIKEISVQRGYNVTGYTMNSFGGAGGQHACMVADALDIKTIFVHPYASVMSAYGIGMADVRFIAKSSVERVRCSLCLRTLVLTFCRRSSLSSRVIWRI